MRIYTLPMADVKAGMKVVCGAGGIKVAIPEPPEGATGFGFMESEVSSEKPQAVLVRQVADGMREAKAEGKKVLWVGGPGVVHTGAAPAMVALVKAGYVDILFAGNALATHDIESALYGTSLGIDLAMGRGVEHGHEHHIRALNTIRKAGSIKDAVDQGVLTGGIMHALVTEGKDFVLVGSVRDDGPLPDVYTDVIEGQRAMRARLKDVGFCIMVATMLHSVATGNILPASIPLVCVDINPATVTKLADRGSSQARGIVTDVGLFLEQLAVELVAGVPQPHAPSAEPPGSTSSHRSTHLAGAVERSPSLLDEQFVDRPRSGLSATQTLAAAPFSPAWPRADRRLPPQVSVAPASTGSRSKTRLLMWTSMTPSGLRRSAYRSIACCVSRCTGIESELKASRTRRSNEPDGYSPSRRRPSPATVWMSASLSWR